MNNLAPIGLSVYSRLEHLKQTVEALRQNELASESELYIFSDAPKPGDENKVQAVRDYLKTINGFKTVHILERKENNRVKNNRDGMRLLLNQCGKMIFLEEDIVTAPAFLRFMNQALEYYRNDPRIFAINGYTPPIRIPRYYNKQVMLLPRFAAWGFAIWKERFDEIIFDVTPDMFNELYQDKVKLKAYCCGGDDIIRQLHSAAIGRTDALDVKTDYTMFVKGRKYVLCPLKALTHSIGCDGSGEHWKFSTDKHNVELDTESKVFKFNTDVQPDRRIMKQMRKFYTLPTKQKLRLFLKDIGLYPLLKYMKDFLRAKA